MDLSRGLILVVGPAHERADWTSCARGLGFAVAEVGSEEAGAAGPSEDVDALLVVGGAPQPAWAQSARRPVVAVVADEAAAAAFRSAGADLMVSRPEELETALVAAVLAARLVRRIAPQDRVLGALVRVMGSLPFEEALERVAAEVGGALASDGCSVQLYPDVAEGAGRPLCAGPPPSAELAGFAELRRALESHKPLVVADALADPLTAGARERLLPSGIRSLLGVPLVHEGATLGVLLAWRCGSPRPYDAAEVGLGGAIAAVLAGFAGRERDQRVWSRKRETLEGAYLDRYADLVDANRRLKDLNQFKDEIIAICSHDLRSPLNVLLGHARLLTSSELEKQDAVSAQAILRQTRKLIAMVESLLDRSRAEAGRLDLEPDEVELAGCCRELAAEHELLGAERGVSIQVRAPQTLDLIADPLKVRQVIENLLENALAHAREGGHVLLNAERLERPDGEMVHVSVSDDGPGVPAERLPFLFERPLQGQGGGLGLRICREFVELHGGEIWASSEPGEGATFHFTLPLSRARLPGEKLNPGSESRRGVLVVEDDPNIAAVTAELLRSRYRVDVARDGAEALAKARAFRPDLILMDVFLPRVDGLDAAATLRAFPDTRDIPLILVSAHQGVAEKVRALGLGAVDYLAKPYQAKELLVRVESALRPAAVSGRAGQPGHPGHPGVPMGAGTDPATPFADRPDFLRRLAQELSRAGRSGRPLFVVALEPPEPLPPGTLTAVAGALRAAVRAGDLIGHLGSGRFAACLVETTAEGAGMVAERLATAFRRSAGAEVRVGLVEGGERLDPEALLLEAAARAAPGGAPR